MATRQQLVALHDELVVRLRETQLKADISSTEEEKANHMRRAHGLAQHIDTIAQRIAEITPKPRKMSVTEANAAFDRLRRRIEVHLVRGKLVRG